MDKLFIIHFQMLEAYPPAQNLIRILEKNTAFKRITVISSKCNLSIPAFETNSTNIKIKRYGIFKMGNPAIIRFFNYGIFYLATLFHLLKEKPKTVLYIETLSSFPVYLYKKFFMRNARIFIHYHEYTSVQEYNSGMYLNKAFHKFEKELYPVAEWVSHTNEDRMQMFKKDLKNLPVKNPRILANYPPAQWMRKPEQEIMFPVKIIYVGALSMQNMYVENFALWVMEQKGKVTWDIYSINMASDASDFFLRLKSPYIKYAGSVEYEKLKDIIQLYDIGVILYKGVVPNHVFSVPNKLIEYSICGLDVWFPRELIGSEKLVIQSSYPKIISLNFLALSGYKLEELIDRKGINYLPIHYNAESEFKNLANALQPKTK